MFNQIMTLVLIALIIGTLIYVCIYSSKQHNIKIVKETSNRYHVRLRVDKDYQNQFINYQNTYSYTHTVKTRKQVDNFDFTASLVDNIRHNAPCDVNKLLSFDEHNRKIVKDYRTALQNLPSLQTQVDLERKGVQMPLQKYRNIEVNLFKIPELKPVLGLFITVKVSYTSPAGRNHYEKQRTFDIKGIKRILADMKTEDFNKEIKKHERSLMSNKLRYEILQRDGFRCVLCGASQTDGVQLEVDHIVPIAKGGKTEPSNLRTLCYNCNRGKSDSYSKKKAN